MPSTFVSYEEELENTILYKCATAMDLLCNDIYESLMQYIQRDIYDKPQKTYERTYEFKRSWKWENSDEGYTLMRTLFSDEKMMTILWESNTGWYAHGNARMPSDSEHPPGLKDDGISSTGNDIPFMAQILNNYFGDDARYHDPYWDDFLSEWTDEKVISTFKKYLKQQGGD